MLTLFWREWVGKRLPIRNWSLLWPSSLSSALVLLLLLQTLALHLVLLPLLATHNTNDGQPTLSERLANKSLFDTYDDPLRGSMPEGGRERQNVFWFELEFDAEG